MTLRIRLVAFVVALLGSVPAASSTQTRAQVSVLSGTLLGADARPMKLAHVRLLHYPAPAAEAVVGPDGGYALATTTTGAFYVEFSGVDHVSTRVPVVLRRHATIGLDVQLRRYPYTDSLDRVVAIGDWNRFDFRTGRPLVKQPDGRYTLEIETSNDTLAYQLLNLSPDRSINGTDAVRYAFDGDGDYRSVIWADKGRATIVLDPSLLDRHPSEEVITFRERDSPEARFSQLMSTLEQWRRSQSDSGLATQVMKRLARERDPFLREVLLCARLQAARRGASLDSALAARIARELRPSSLAWSFCGLPGDMVFAQARLRDPRVTVDHAERDSSAVQATLPYLESVVAEHPDVGVRANALGTAALLALAVLERDRASRYYARLVAEYPDASLIPVLKAELGPDRVLRVGAVMPGFRFAALDDSTRAYTREDLTGKVYLLEFWATWCKPCIDDMPYLQQVYDSLHGKGLEILSVSLDGDPDDVNRFRASQWKMPWLHGLVRDGFKNAEMVRFEIGFLPRMALVGPDGRIIAVDEDLRGDRLTATLRRAFR